MCRRGELASALLLAFNLASVLTATAQISVPRTNLPPSGRSDTTAATPFWLTLRPRDDSSLVSRGSETDELASPGPRLRSDAFCRRPASADLAAPTLNQSLWGADGTVTTILRAGNTIYIAGAFGSVGPSTGGGVPISVGDGTVRTPYARVAGYVWAVASDGRGGWYIGGEFSTVGGVHRHNLAHVLADGSVAPWDPNPDGLRIRCIVVRGNTVLVGGSFSSIGDQPRRHLAAINSRTGRATNWAPNPNALVTSIQLHGRTAFVAGGFDTIAGVPRGYLAAIDAHTGTALPWRADANNRVDALLLHKDVLFIGGRFGYLQGQRRPLLGAVSVDSGALEPFYPDGAGRDWGYPYLAPPTVATLALRDSVLYVGGWFTRMGGLPRDGFAALDRVTGAATPLDLGLGGLPYVQSLVIHENLLYLGGWIGALGDQTRSGLAAIDLGSGRVTEWNPTTNHEVLAMALDGHTLYAGGTFTSIGPWVRRRCLAALDATTGAATSWNANPVGLITSGLAMHNGVLYAAGDFIGIGGEPRRCLGAVDTVTGAAVGWRADLDFDGWGGRSILVVGDTLYVGGIFTSIGGMSKSNLASVDLTSGEPTSWDPQVDDFVQGLATDGHTVFAAGFFDHVGGISRGGLAAFNRATGELLPWNPSAEHWVNSLAVKGDIVYVGGRFDYVGGQPRRNLAAVSATTGLATQWDPRPNAEVRAVVVHESILYAGGFFDEIGGQPRGRLSGIDPVTGVPTPWDPHADDNIYGLASFERTLLVGGRFNSIGGFASSSVAAFEFPEPSGREGQGVVERRRGAQVHELMAVHVGTTGATITFDLRSSLDVRLLVFDVQGRRIATVLDGVRLAAGEHSISVATSGLASGLYLVRIEAGHQSATRKLLLIR